MQLAKTYLSDVLDHMDAVLSSLELFSGLASNLVDFSCAVRVPATLMPSFNTLSFQTNQTVTLLTYATVRRSPRGEGLTLTRSWCCP